MNFHIISLDETVTNIKNILTKKRKLALFTTIILGFIIHFELYSQLFTGNPDSLWNGLSHLSNLWELSLGRYGLYYMDKLTYGLASPIISTTLSIIFTALTTIILIELLDIKNEISIILTSAFCISFPVLTNVLTYYYCSANYCLSFLFSVLSVFCIYKLENIKPWKRILMGAILFNFSISLYQTYIGITTSLCIIIPILHILKNFQAPKEINKKILESIIMGILGISIYYIITHLLLLYYHLNLSSYSGANEIGLQNFKNIKQIFIETYQIFYNYYFTDKITINSSFNRQYLNAIFFVIIFINYVSIIIKNKTFKNKFLFCELIIFTLLLPFSINIIKLVAPKRNVGLLMCMPLLLPFIMNLSLIETVSKKTVVNLLSWLSVIISTVIILTYIITASATYITIKLNYNNAISITNRILTQIEANPNYDINIPILFAGNIKNNDSYYNSTVSKFATGNVSNWNVFWNDYEGSLSTWSSFINLYCGGKTVNFCNKEDYLKIIKSEEFKNMNTYPNTNSIKIINNIMVVKFTNEPATE